MSTFKGASVMSVSVVRLGSPRARGEGIRIGTVRHPPRGVRKQDFARLNYFDVWLPQIAPSSALVSAYKKGFPTAESWKRFQSKYLKELEAPDNARLLRLLAEMSKTTDFSIGCYCEHPDRCHRSILAEALKAHGALILAQVQ
jgi:uncharacterized protein YeaO (DUF488 family)